jgi:hypothetical protein
MRLFGDRALYRSILDDIGFQKFTRPRGNRWRCDTADTAIKPLAGLRIARRHRRVAYRSRHRRVPVPIARIAGSQALAGIAGHRFAGH